VWSANSIRLFLSYWLYECKVSAETNFVHFTYKHKRTYQTSSDRFSFESKLRVNFNWRFRKRFYRNHAKSFSASMWWNIIKYLLFSRGRSLNNKPHEEYSKSHSKRQPLFLLLAGLFCVGYDEAKNHSKPPHKNTKRTSHGLRIFETNSTLTSQCFDITVTPDNGSVHVQVCIEKIIRESQTPVCEQIGNSSVSHRGGSSQWD